MTKMPHSRLPYEAVLLTCIIPVIAVIAPRALAFVPAIIGLITYGRYRIIYGQWASISRPILISLISLFTLMSLSVLWGYDHEAITLSQPLKTAPIFLGIALLTSVFYTLRAEIMPLFARFFPYACIIAGGIVLINLYCDSAIYRLARGQNFSAELGNLSHLNRSVVAFTVMTLLTISLIFAQEKLSENTSTPTVRWLPILLFSILALALLRTHSQSAQLAAMASLLIAAIAPCSRNFLWPTLAVLISGLLLSAPFIAQALFQHLSTAMADMAWIKEGYGAARSEIWDFIARRALERPWLGHGIKATGTITDFDFAHLYHPFDMILHPHNFALQIWIEFGLLGAVIFSAIISFCILSTGHNKSIAGRRIQLSLFTAILIMAAISYGMWQGWWVGLIGFIFATCHLAYPKDQDVDPSRSAAHKA